MLIIFSSRSIKEVPNLGTSLYGFPSFLILILNPNIDPKAKTLTLTVTLNPSPNPNYCSIIS